MDLRRQLTRRNLFKAAGATAVLGAVDGLGLEPRWLEVSAHQLPVADLPHALAGLTIVQVTDAHLSRLGVVEQGIVDAVRQADAQLVVLTGDLIDDMAHGPALAELCAELRRTGAEVIATLGNWERWRNLPIPELAALYQRSGATLLIDEWHALEAGGLALYASDDSTGGSPRPLTQNPAGAAPVEVLLTHSPAFVDAAAVELGPASGLGFDLCLAGHTHGGQVTAFGWPPILPEGSGRFCAGWYETELAACGGTHRGSSRRDFRRWREAETQLWWTHCKFRRQSQRRKDQARCREGFRHRLLGPLYVSRGTGTSLVPARFCCRPELPVIRLVRG